MTGSVRSVRQAFAILRLLADSGPLTLSNIGAALGLSPSSCLNLLRTLVAESALVRDPDTKRYRLAPGWADSAPFRDDRAQAMLARLHPRMARLAREQGATIGLWTIASGQRMQLVGHAECDAAMRIQLADGQRQPLGSGAVGRSLAAAQGIDQAELARRFAGVRWRMSLSLACYREEVRLAGERGYAIDDGTGFAGVCSVAATVAGDPPQFVLSASIFAGSRDEAGITELGLALVAASRGE